MPTETKRPRSRSATTTQPGVASVTTAAGYDDYNQFVIKSLEEQLAIHKPVSETPSHPEQEPRREAWENGAATMLTAVRDALGDAREIALDSKRSLRSEIEARWPDDVSEE